MAGVEFLVGGWVASPVIKSVLEKAQMYLSANYDLQKGTKGMVDELTGILLLCQATVIEAEKKEIINNAALGDWLRRLKETIYDAEDLLDNMEAKSIKEKVQGKNKVSKVASSSLSGLKNMFIPDNNYKRLKKVVDKLKDFSQITHFLELVNKNNKNESQTHEATDSRENISQPLEEVVLCGREVELNQILDIILGSESESSKKGGHGLLVIPIVGMGGVGKTALAQAVYNNPNVQKKFASKAWISIFNKPDVDVKSVMREIYKSLGFSCPDLITLQDIFMKITSCIGEVGKFLIVLDDLFEINEDKWKCLSNPLSRCAPGSVVLITTQNKVFAKSVGTFGPIALSPLDLDIFWELFEHFAFRNEEIPKDKRKTLKSIAKKISEKLRGLPLAAEIIGKQLKTNLDEESWSVYLKSEWWEWDIPEGKSRILQSIGLSYKQLHPSLRQCFAYCSVFPRKSLIEKDRLVHMWIAQNFIHSDVRGGKTLQDIGRQWFDELVKKSFFQARENNSYVMHDLMHDLAVIVSKGECFYLGEGLVGIPSGVRHLALDTHNLDVIKGIRTHKNLRSFLYFESSEVEGMYNAINNTLSVLDNIRVLDLSDMNMKKERKPPTNIWKLQHLRFLDLSSTGIQFLTHSSINLYQLQALYIKKCESLKLPKGIEKLTNLHHLCTDEQTNAQISGIGQVTFLQKLKSSLFVKKRDT